MNRFVETILTMVRAARYALAFCLRNARTETIIRIGTAVVSTLLGYLVIQATGWVINTTQELITAGGGKPIASSVVAEGLWGPLAFLTGLLLFGVVFGTTWIFRSRWNQKLRHGNERELNEHRASLDYGRFKSKEYDDLSTRIRDLPTSWQTRIWFSEKMLELFGVLVSFALFGAALLWYKPVYAVILLATSLPMMFVEFRFVVIWWQLYYTLVPHHKTRGVMERAYHAANAFLQGLMFNQHGTLKKDIHKNQLHVYDSYDAIRRSSATLEVYAHMVSKLGLSGVLIHAIWLTVTQAGGIGTLTVIIAAARTFQSNLETVVTLMAEQWTNAKGVILLEEEFFRLKPILQTPDPVSVSFTSPPRIVFENVSFAYPQKPEIQVLKDVSFTIEPGSKTAIVGKSGNGKSTILHLLMRHFDPVSGVVSADGIPLRRIIPSRWNETASALTQDYDVLERTVGAEIASSRLEIPAERARLDEAARFSRFDEVVSSDPMGYDSQIGTSFGGREFSGGEKQRLALARVFYREPKILILDEPDARLDVESADKIIDHIFDLEGVTVIMITHHVSRAERCDKVIVMGKGEVVEEGNPRELLLTDSTFASLYEKDKERLGT